MNFLGHNKNKHWSFKAAKVLLLIGIFSNFIANEKPLYCQIEEKTYFPAFKELAISMGFSQWESQFFNIDWLNYPYQKVIRCPIPYSGSTMDKQNTGCKSPFGEQQVKSIFFRHWLGTDQLGRDVMAGLVAGTRTALLVGLMATLVAGLIGISLGALAGYYGDYNLKSSWVRIILNLIALFLAYFYAFQTRAYIFSKTTNFFLEILKSMVICSITFILANYLAKILEKGFRLKQKVSIPLDLIVMRFIEVFNAIPRLLLILSLIVVLSQSSIYMIMLIIGFISWTGIAKLMRAEMLRIRNIEYIQAARALGMKEFQILLKQAIPNTMSPIFVALAFAMANAILLESTLSFLGIGLGVEQVSWGSLLTQARSYFTAWWLAIFPGVAIAFTVILFNVLGDKLNE